MTPLVENVTTLISLGIVLIDILIVIGFLALIFWKNNSGAHKVLNFIARHGLLIGFLLTLAGFLTSMFYSTVAGFIPCELCWWNRIFMFPQVLIFGTALYQRWRKGMVGDEAFRYSFVLSVVGGLIALYTYYGQSFNPSALPNCSAQGVSCAMLYFTKFGYITIPVMSLTGFVALILIYFIKRQSLLQKPL